MNFPFRENYISITGDSKIMVSKYIFLSSSQRLKRRKNPDLKPTATVSLCEALVIFVGGSLADVLNS